MRIFAIFGSAAGFVLSLLAWAWLSGVAAPLGMPPPPGLGAAALANLLPLTGIVAGSSAVWLSLLFRQRGGEASDGGSDGTTGERSGSASNAAGATGAAPYRSRAESVALMLGFAFAGIVVLLLTAVAQSQIKPVAATLVLVCSALALLAGGHAVEALARGDEIGISSHWGGLGGSLSGWRLSSVTTLLLLVLIFLGIIIATSQPAGPPAIDPPAKQTAGAAAPPAATRTITGRPSASAPALPAAAGAGNSAGAAGPPTPALANLAGASR